MKTLIFALTLLITAPAFATPLTWDFAGTVAYTLGTIDGTFTYESTETPSAFNIHNLNGNTAYAVQSWNFTVQTNFIGIPSLVDFPSSVSFSNTLGQNTSELCLGKCIFSNTFFDRLLFTNERYTLQLLWNPTTGSLPQTINDWGTLSVPSPTTGGNSYFQSMNADGTLQVRAFLTAGSITGLSSPQPVPEPSTLWLLMAAGVGLMAVWLRRQWL